MRESRKNIYILGTNVWRPVRSHCCFSLQTMPPRHQRRNTCKLMETKVLGCPEYDAVCSSKILTTSWNSCTRYVCFWSFLSPITLPPLGAACCRHETIVLAHQKNCSKCSRIFPSFFLFNHVIARRRERLLLRLFAKAYRRCHISQIYIRVLHSERSVSSYQHGYRFDIVDFVPVESLPNVIDAKFALFFAKPRLLRYVFFLLDDLKFL